MQLQRNRYGDKLWMIQPTIASGVLGKGVERFQCLLEAVKYTLQSLEGYITSSCHLDYGSLNGVSSEITDYQQPKYSSFLETC